MKNENRIKELRLRKGWTQDHLADRMNQYGGVKIDPSTVRRHERGKRSVRAPRVLLIGKASR